MTCKLSNTLREAQQEIPQSPKDAHLEWTEDQPGEPPALSMRYVDNYVSVWRNPPRQPEETPPSRAVPHVGSSQISTEKRSGTKIPLDIASYKLYYVNYKIGLNLRLSHTPAQKDSGLSLSLSPTSCRRFSWIFVGQVRS